jgi:intracellular multiplication protein IcmJ
MEHVKSLKPITLSVKRGLFRRDDPRTEESNDEFKRTCRKVMRRDNYRCQYCGFCSDKWQEVHHLNDDHTNNSKDNLITVCPLCHKANHIGLAGYDGSGVIIYIENLNQAELNNIVRSLWIAEDSGDREMKLTAMTMLARFHKFTSNARRGIGASDPSILGNYLLELDDEAYAKRESALNGYLLLPLRKGFEKQLKHWKTNNYKNVNPSTWLRIAESKADIIIS